MGVLFNSAFAIVTASPMIFVHLDSTMKGYNIGIKGICALFTVAFALEAISQWRKLNSDEAMTTDVAVTPGFRSKVINGMNRVLRDLKISEGGQDIEFPIVKYNGLKTPQINELIRQLIHQYIIGPQLLSQLSLTENEGDFYLKGKISKSERGAILNSLGREIDNLNSRNMLNEDRGYLMAKLGNVKIPHISGEYKVVFDTGAAKGIFSLMMSQKPIAGKVVYGVELVLDEEAYKLKEGESEKDPGPSSINR